MTAWIVRAGVNGERDSWALDESRAGGGFNEVSDLTADNTREQVADRVNSAFSGAHPQKIANFTGQLWALRSRIHQGDLIVLPLKSTKRVAIGRCSGGYEYLTDEKVDRRHSIKVNWIRTDIPRSAFKDDLLNTINGAMTIFQASNNNAESRLEAMLEPESSDPGSTYATLAPAVSTDAGTPVDPVPDITLEGIRDRVRTHLAENFGKHKLTSLIAEILRAEGYVCHVSPEGPDFGVDILAGRGPLGLDPPTLVVEVKSEAGQIGVPVLNQLQGAVNSHHADQALLVAWGGLNNKAEQLRMTQRLRVAVWTDEDILDHLFGSYGRLPEAVRGAIPLKHAWVLVAETG